MPLNHAFETFPTLDTKRLILRRIYPADAGALFAVLRDEQVTEYYDDDAFTEVSQASDQIEAWERAYQNRSAVRWGITQKDGGQLIGTCGYYGFHSWYLRAAIGYELSREYWRQGIMTEAVSALIEYGIDELGLNRIQALVMPGNTASIRLLEKLGFQNEGLLKEYEKWGSKGLVDLDMFALLRADWEQIRL